MTTNQKKDFLIEVVFALFILAVVFLLYKYILPITLPFILGLLVAWIVVKITNRFHTKNKWLRAGIVILIYVIFAAVAMVVLVAFMTWIGEKIVNVPSPVGYYVQMNPVIKQLAEELLAGTDAGESEAEETALAAVVPEDTVREEALAYLLRKKWIATQQEFRQKK